MKIKHHIMRKYQQSKQAPLWKWLVVIFIIIAMPLFYTFVNVTQIQQALWNSGQEKEIKLPNK